MIAAWQVRPPRLVTIAAARFITGSQSGSVISVTSTSPACTRSISRRRPNEAHLALPDLLADGAAGREHPARAASGDSGAGARHLFLRLHRLRPRLQDVELAVLAVAAPFDVHRPAVVALDGDGGARQRLGLGVA